MSLDFYNYCKDIAKINTGDMSFFWDFDNASAIDDDLNQHTGIPLSGSPLNISTSKITIAGSECYSVEDYASIDNSEFSVLIDYERDSSGAPILLTTEDTLSGFTFGITDTNYAYLQVRPNENETKSFVFDVPLGKRNSVALVKSDNKFTLYNYDYSTSGVDSDSIQVDYSISGNYEFLNFGCGADDLGLIDKIYYFDKSFTSSKVNTLLKGMYSTASTSFEVVESGTGVNFLNFTPTQSQIDGIQDIHYAVFTGLSSINNYTGYYSGVIKTGDITSNVYTFTLNYGTVVGNKVTLGNYMVLSGPTNGVDSTFEGRTVYDFDEIENIASTVALDSYTDSSFSNNYVHSANNYRLSSSNSFSIPTRGSLYLMDGVSVYDCGDTITGDGTTNGRSDEFNQIPKYSLINGYWKTNEDSTGIFLNVSGNETNYTLTSREIPVSLPSDIDIRYDISLSKHSASTNSFGSFTDSIGLGDFVRGTSMLYNTTDGGNRMFKDSQYKEIITYDLLYNNAPFCPTGDALYNNSDDYWV